MTLPWQPIDVGARRAQRYVREGFWDDETLGALLAGGLDDARDEPFVVRSERAPYRGSLGDVFDLARRVATGLRARGVGPGDAIAFQLPNWVEAATTFYACALLGAVVVPIVHFYGAKEVGYILRRTRVQGLVTTDAFGHVDYVANLAAMRSADGGLPDLEWVAFVDAPPIDATSFGFGDLADATPIDGPVAVDPNDAALVAYTSGTTSEPKGVVHSHRTIGAEMRQLGAIQAAGPPALTGAPVGHAIGMLAALLLPVQRRHGIHLIDVWEPGRVLAAMLADGLSAGQGATFFLTSLLDHPDFDPARHGALMPYIGLGGSAVPAAVTERARAIGIECSRSFGSTEHPSITGSAPADPWEQRCRTDGKALPGVELRLVDEEERDVAPGVAGEIWSRGPDCAWGYTDPALTAAAFTSDGWYRTGDIGVLDADGALSITDRKKDIIIRGGENISAVEIEELLVRMPGVAEVAVVAAPDARLGEHACAFVRVLPGAPPPTLDAVRATLDDAGLARQKWPEELRVVDALPRTPSGKVQKYVLRDQLRAEPH
ncbi:MAG TPA: AMP-binding protein [Acidimicrobiia bacterium]|nr:AMP-binding protein [Acidimicrobiia bacterium]